ncbi:MAG TPA: alpha/beta hydrolase-fold protein [Mesorhizobium sp.]|jgi:predicted esterase|nr:alpha/beta hydrolase-fold protein [Mesorhizobium sp.]
MILRPFSARAQPSAAEGALQARPLPAPQVAPLGPGTHRLGLTFGRDALLHVPASLDASRPVPLALSLHGAGGTAPHGLALLQAIADRHGFLLLAPDSRRPDTWDVIRGGYGPDVAYINEALRFVFERFAVDPRRVAVGGFSDGGSYALCLGLMNGDLFGDVLAFSPGFAAPARLEGRPRVFISHGVHDTVLPIERCGRRLARELSGDGYDVDYREFDGGHVVPPELAEAAAERFLGES